MTAKQLRFSNDARDALHRGVDAVADAVSVTLGPRGRNVVIDKRFGAPLIINDGVTIARDLEFKDHFENMGAQLLKEIAVKTNDIAGDGTTTATVLGRALINEGLRNLAAGASPTELRRGMNAAADAVITAVRAQSHEVAGNEDLQRVASISSGDEGIGTMIAEAFERVGREGVVTVEEGSGIDTEVDVVEGMQFDRGYVSPYLVTDQKAMEAVLDKAAVLITDAKITAVADLLPALELVVQSGRPLLIVAEDVQAEALATLVVNRLRGSFTAVAVKAPAFGDRRTAVLTDIAVLTGATVISEKVGLRLDAVRLDQLGSADRIVVTKEDTTILKGGGDRAAVKARAEDIRREIEETESEWDREKLQERLARLVGGIAVVKVGAATEVEMKERKSRVEDALAAVRAALAEGYVVGGGVALLRSVHAIDGLTLEADAATGARIVRRALQEPLRIIAQNGGFDGPTVANHVAELSGDEGFDARTGDYGNLVERGVIDPTKVVVSALTHATSIATIVLTTEALIADAPEPEDDEAGGAGHGHSHGGGMGGMDGMGGMGGMGMGDDLDF
ncbi:MAG: chaperonin GroEL [Candidatus Dormibacteraeota bacterium]|uniref:Chaperonin GroEL n=2 Tax=Candidatus Aeolococcus gillhamiae TaxID=3127015 RepID=A0A934K2J1_9BACT|nr:chaperonin GroEL [Candidatus Dormibacteraeota bacterium]